MPADASSVSLARHRLIELLRERGWDESSVGGAALMATELITNAVLHAKTQCRVTVAVDGTRVRVDVCDESPTMPRIGPMPSADAASGRGLALVAQLADRWGCDSVPGGKSVWFETAMAPG